MHEIPKDDDRKVIPRWRQLRRTPATELRLARVHRSVDEIEMEFRRVIADWSSHRTIENASEVLFVGALGEKSDLVEDAARLIIESDEASHNLKRLAISLINEETQHAGAPEETFDLESDYSFEIRMIKRKLEENPRNAVLHVEVARLYASQGLTKQAASHLRVALELAPTHRFVLRSAARFYVHRDELKRSWNILKSAAEHDPWVAAAFVSVADLGDLEVPGIKKFRELMAASADPGQITELAAALGTLELKSGGIKKARKLFRVSARAPNENVVAQLFWLSQRYGVAFDVTLLESEKTHEARAAHAAVAESWMDAIKSCAQWFEDEPFSVRPAQKGSFLACEMLRDYKLGQNFSNRGLRANPKDITLLNNLVFALIMDDKLSEAASHLERAKRLVVDDRDKLFLTATEGLLHYRQGRIADGVRHYMHVLGEALSMKSRYLIQLAYLHFCYEEVRIGHTPPLGISDEQIRKEFDNAKDVSIREIYNQTLLPLLEARRKYGLQEKGYRLGEDIFENPALEPPPTLGGLVGS
jgi:tetratricopeptide (TPR) repeat protein